MFYSEFSELLLLNTVKTQYKKNTTERKLRIIKIHEDIFFQKLEDTVLAYMLLKDYIDNKINYNQHKLYNIKDVKNMNSLQLLIFIKKYR